MWCVGSIPITASKPTDELCAEICYDLTIGETACAVENLSYCDKVAEDCLKYVKNDNDVETSWCVG